MSPAGEGEARPRAAGRERPVSARELARDLGVSVSTVSRAFSPDSTVAPETRLRVLARAKEVGYRPNPFARTLITNRTRLASIFISDIFNPFFSEALISLTEALQEYGLRVMLFYVPSGKSPEDVLHEALLYQPEYVIVMTATTSFQKELAALEPKAHLIFFNRYVPGANAFSVTCDNRRGGAALAKLLIETGHRRLAYIAGTPDATTSIDRGRGFVQTCAAAGISVVQDAEAKIFSYEDGRAAAKRLMERHPDIDGIFGANDLVAFGALHALRYELGLDVPGDVSVVGFDDVAMARWPPHHLTTYRHPVLDMTAATLELIRQIDDHPDFAPEARRIPGALVLRQTHRDRRGDGLVLARRGAGLDTKEGP